MRGSASSGDGPRTRLSRFHPYPAMVADELAIDLARSHVRPGQAVLDPFCGSGRLLIAGAAVPGEFLGIDVNPLACLITMAKATDVRAETISELIADIEDGRQRVKPKPLYFREQRKVPWYSDAVLAEIGQMVSWINEMKLDLPYKTVMATAFSAAVRDASYCEIGRWKLHRINVAARRKHVKSAWDCLKRRLQLYAGETTGTGPPKGNVSVVRGNAADVVAGISSRTDPLLFDLVITSPPYGDSKTTVQYGAASALCLDAVSQIDGFEEFFMQGVDIDRQCLGGSRRSSVGDREISEIPKRYWGGAQGTKTAATVAAFLADVSFVFAQVTGALKPKGRAVVVLGRRSVGGFRVKLDLLLVDCMERLGLRLESRERRALHDKQLPRRINRFGRAASDHIRAKGLTKTMSEEFILTFEMPPNSQNKSQDDTKCSTYDTGTAPPSRSPT